MDLYPKIERLALVARTSETIPKAGTTTTYTSGCPKNQNKCWNNSGSPPAVKNVVPIVESNSKKNMPITNAGRLTYSMNTLIRTDQVNRGILIHPTPFARIVNVVVTKLTPDNVEDAPSKAIPDMKAIVPGFGPPACPVRLE